MIYVKQYVHEHNMLYNMLCAFFYSLLRPYCAKAPKKVAAAGAQKR